MSQQLVNGSYRKSDVTFTYRMSDRYAVVSEPFTFGAETALERAL